MVTAGSSLGGSSIQSSHRNVETLTLTLSRSRTPPALTLTLTLSEAWVPTQWLLHSVFMFPMSYACWLISVMTATCFSLFTAHSSLLTVHCSLLSRPTPPHPTPPYFHPTPTLPHPTPCHLTSLHLTPPHPTLPHLIPFHPTPLHPLHEQKANVRSQPMNHGISDFSVDAGEDLGLPFKWSVYVGLASWLIGMGTFTFQLSHHV